MAQDLPTSPSLEFSEASKEDGADGLNPPSTMTSPELGNGGLSQSRLLLLPQALMDKLKPISSSKSVHFEPSAATTIYCLAHTIGI